jgi:hypothetical protein
VSRVSRSELAIERIGNGSHGAFGSNSPLSLQRSIHVTFHNEFFHRPHRIPPEIIGKWLTIGIYRLNWYFPKNRSGQILRVFAAVPPGFCGCESRAIVDEAGLVFVELHFPGARKF